MLKRYEMRYLAPGSKFKIIEAGSIGEAEQIARSECARSRWVFESVRIERKADRVRRLAT